MYKKKIIFTSIIALGFAMSPLIVSADNDVTVKTNDNKVILELSPKKNEYYKIYKDDQLEYSGTNNKYTDYIDQSQKYKIGVYSNGKLNEVLSVKAADNKHNIFEPTSMNTAEKEEYIDSIVQNTRLETIVTSNSVTIQWPKLPDEDNVYEIFKNNVKIAETTDLHYVDTNVESGKEYNYMLKINNVVSEETADLIKNEAIKEKIVLTDEMFEYDGSISTLVAIPSVEEESLTEDPIMDPIFEKAKGSGTIGTKAIPKSNEFSFDYRTYIPFKSVKNPNVLTNDDYPYLKGDNRSNPTAYSDKYRTEARVYAMLSQPAAVTLWKSVSESHYCTASSCSSPKSLGTASDSGIKLLKHRVKTNDLMWAVNHAVGVPKISAPKIDYNYVAQLSNKSFIAYGKHDRAPSHEFYMNYPTGSKKIYSHQVTSPIEFLLLFGVVQGSWSFDM